MTETIALRESTLTIIEGVARMTHMRPAQRNALTLALREDYREMVQRIASDRSIRVLVLSGSGGSFCSGGDVRAMQTRRAEGGQEDSPDATRRRMLAAHDWLQRLRDLEIPVVAAVDGPAFGAGFSLALCADFIIASRGAVFNMSFNRIGVVPDMGAMFLLPRLIGLARAKEILMTARRVDADEAFALGLVLSLHESDELEDASEILARRLAKAPQPSMGLTKRLTNRAFELDAQAAAELEASAQAVCMASEAHGNAIDRFLRREPFAFDWDAAESPRAK